MSAETFSLYVLLINYVLYNKAVLDHNIIYFYQETNLINCCSFVEIINCLVLTKSLHGENAEFINITAGGKYTYHCALNCYLFKCRPTNVQLI